MKKITLLLIVLLASLEGLYAKSLEISFDKFSFDPLPTIEENRVQANRSITTSYLSFELDRVTHKYDASKNGIYNILIDIEDDVLLLDHPFGVTTYKLEENEVKAIKDIRFIKLTDSNLKVNEESIYLEGVLGEINLLDYELDYFNTVIECSLRPALGINKENILNSCMNNVSLLPFKDAKSFEIAFNSSNIEVSAKLQKVSSLKDNFIVTGEDFKLITSIDKVLKNNVLILEASMFKTYCQKEEFSINTDSTDIIRNCLKDSYIVAPQTFLKYEPWKLEANLKTDSFSSNGKRIEYKSPQFNISRGDDKISVDNIVAFCKVPELDKNFEVEQILKEGCLKSSELTTKNLKYENSEGNAEIKESKISLNEHKLTIGSPVIKYVNKESLKIEAFNNNISCSRLADDNRPFDMQSVLEGCFESSEIKIDKISVTHPSIDTALDIKNISLDKNKIQLSSPRGKYIINGTKTDFQDLEFACTPNATYEIASNLDWQTLLANCIHGTKVSIKELSKEGFFIDVLKSISYDTASKTKDNFSLDIKVKFLFIPYSIGISGRINFVREENQILIDIDEATFMQFPATYFVKILLNAFVSSDYLKADGDRYRILLPVEAEKKK